MTNSKKYLEQYDSGDPSMGKDGALSEEQLSMLFPLIGELAVAFNYVESSLDYQIADVVNSRSRQPGYTITAELGNFTKKILVFRALYGPAIESLQNKKLKETYEKVLEDLFKVKDVRNDVLHANWKDASSLFEVKLRLITDEKGVYSKTEKMDPDFLRGKIGLLNKLWEELELFSIALSEVS